MATNSIAPMGHETHAAAKREAPRARPARGFMELTLLHLEKDSYSDCLLDTPPFAPASRAPPEWVCRPTSIIPAPSPYQTRRPSGLCRIVRRHRRYLNVQSRDWSPPARSRAPEAREPVAGHTARRISAEPGNRSGSPVRSRGQKRSSVTDYACATGER